MFPCYFPILPDRFSCYYQACQRPGSRSKVIHPVTFPRVIRQLYRGKQKKRGSCRSTVRGGKQISNRSLATASNPSDDAVRTSGVVAVPALGVLVQLVLPGCTLMAPPNAERLSMR